MASLFHKKHKVVPLPSQQVQRAHIQPPLHETAVTRCCWLDVWTHPLLFDLTYGWMFDIIIYYCDANHNRVGILRVRRCLSLDVIMMIKIPQTFPCNELIFFLLLVVGTDSARCTRQQIPRTTKTSKRAQCFNGNWSWSFDCLHFY